MTPRALDVPYTVRFPSALLARVKALRGPLDSDPERGPDGPWTESKVLRRCLLLGIIAEEQRLGVKPQKKGRKSTR